MQIALLGYGRMGRAVEAVARERGHEMTLTIRAADAPEVGGDELDARLETADVAVDFSTASAVPAHTAWAARAGVDLVVGTTGWEASRDEVLALAREGGIGFLHAPNFSLGAQLLFRLAAVAGSLAASGGYDVHVLETHHRHKADRPSGTALRLAEILTEALPEERGEGDGPADPGPPSVTSIRVGESPGVHVVGLEGPEDRLELRHEARGRRGFARGAVEAAEWLRGRTGVFTLDDLLDERLAGARGAS